MANEQTETFKQHVGKLRLIAEKMCTRGDTDIDQLIPEVDSALPLYESRHKSLTWHSSTVTNPSITS
jgi:hypothetical protein